MGYHCRSCGRFEYNGENSKGDCDYYGASYWPDDSCDHWITGGAVDERDDDDEEDSGGSSGVCFLTTACCQYKGLPDDCAELQALRRFRDGYVKRQSYGEELISAYYEDAPGLVKAIDARTDRAEIYEGIFTRIHEIMDLISAGQNDRAVIRYLMMVYGLKRSLGGVV